jgi:hypothetical protein
MFRTIFKNKINRKYISIYAINNPDHLCNALEKEFRKSKSIKNWKAEINKLRQKRDEFI